MVNNYLCMCVYVCAAQCPPLNLEVIAGLQGEVGPRGLPGYNGPKGDSGERGPSGLEVRNSIIVSQYFIVVIILSSFR